MTDFDVTIQDASDAVHTFSRITEDNPKIVRKDPLQGHMDCSEVERLRHS